MGSIVRFFVSVFQSYINIIFIILFALAAFGCYKFLFAPLRSITDELRAVQDILAKYDKSTILNNYENLKSELAGTFLAKAWSDYDKTVLKTQDDNGNVIPYATEDVSDYISTTAALQGLKINFFKSFAGIFTGMGILGTFIGLTAGLTQLDASTTKSLQEGIPGLLSGMTAAFFTSILGIVAAIIYNYLYSDRMKVVDVLVASICAKVDELIDRKSVSDLLYDNYQQSKERTNQIRVLNDDLVMRLGELFEKSSQAMDDSLDRSLKENLLPVFQQLTTAIDNLNNSGVAKLQEGLQKGAGEQLSGFAQSIEHLQTNLEETIRQSRDITSESNAKMQAAIDSLVEKLNTAADANIQSQKQGAEDTNKAMQQLILELNTNLKTAVSEMMESSAKANRALMESSAGANQKLVEAAKDATQTVQDMNAASAKNTKVQQEALNKAASDFKDTLTETLKQLREEMKQHDAAMRAVLNNLNSVTSNNKAVMDSAKKTAAQFERASGPVQKAADAMGSQITKVVEASDRFSTSISSNVRQLSDASQTTQKNLQEIKKSLEDMEETWMEYADHFDKVKGELQAAYDTLNKGTGSTLETLNKGMEGTLGTLNEGMQRYNASAKEALGKTLEEYDKSISKSLDGIRSMVEDLTDTVDDLEKAADKLGNTPSWRR